MSKDIKVATVGDSLSVDPPSSLEYYHYPSQLQLFYDVTQSDSFAVGAAQTGSAQEPKGMRLQYEDSVANAGYNLLIVLGGVNDVASGRSVSFTEDNLGYIYSQAKSKGMKVAAIPILPWGCFYTADGNKIAQTKQINTWIENNTDVDYFIDVYDLFNDGNDCLKQEYSLDNIHVNRAGHDKLAEIINAIVFEDQGGTMACGEVGCSAAGDDIACGWPESQVECKSGYNDGEGRCEIVCPDGTTKTDICVCTTVSATPTVTATPTITSTPTETISPSLTITNSPILTTLTPSPTGTTITLSPTNTVIVTTSIPRTNSPTPTRGGVTQQSEKPSGTIPATAGESDTFITVILGFLTLLIGIYLNSLKTKGVMK
jgi:lysophospholipase L1-like esterase